MTLDIKDFFLQTDMEDWEYMRMWMHIINTYVKIQWILFIYYVSRFPE